MSIPHIKAFFWAPTEVIMLEPFKELRDDESDLACIISPEDNPTSNIKLGMPGKTASLWTIKPYFVVVLIE